MSQYLPISNEQAARELSADLWNLASPPATRTPDHTTVYYCGWIQDVSGQWYLGIPSDQPLPVHPDITPEMIAAVVDQIERQEDALP